MKTRRASFFILPASRGGWAGAAPSRRGQQGGESHVGNQKIDARRLRRGDDRRGGRGYGIRAGDRGASLSNAGAGPNARCAPEICAGYGRAAAPAGGRQLVVVPPHL